MIIGIGTDIVQIARIDASSDRLGEKFAARILTPDELQQWQEHARPTVFLAKRFAVKEAASKALGTGIGRGVSWQHFHIDHNEWGAPQLRLSDGAAERAEQLGVNRIHLTLSDEQDHVVAFVVLEQ
ncbi:holo-ACP synthase [Motiliproteus sp.]|uniref:holo-ACP synthase n=1 Tax=Motiliproteus sp. TaxID=1898955 RepID=UPI003BAD8BEA